MKVGILGFSGSGKTAVFNLLTGLDASTGYGGARKPNLGVIKVPDERIDRLSALFSPKKTTYAEVHFVDVAGRPPEDANSALEQSVLSPIRDTDALVLVVRGFGSPMFEADPTPLQELMDLETEMILTDLGITEKRLTRLKKERRQAEPEAKTLERVQEHLEAEKPLRTLELSDDERVRIRGFQFLTLKPGLALLNTSEDDPTAIPDGFEALCAERGLEMLGLCATIEAELGELDDEDKAEFLAEYGIDAPAKDRFIRAAYHLLDLISMFTVGPDEVRAWTIRRGTKAPRAGRTIHSDIEKGFIRAEVTPWKILLELGGEQQAKAAGKMRLEGKEYVIKDGEIVHFRFNV